ncbi:MAG TPA: YCF48-related protein [Chloroflexota bacterium]|nr:YCF48-related protein [Chloroflexota bacterium]
MAGQTILVATIGQGIMRSEDSGESWRRVRGGLHSEAMVRNLLVTPGAAPRVYAATDRGLYCSDDRGEHWALVDSPLCDYAVWAVAQDPRNPSTLYAGTGTHSRATLFRTEDGGRRWEERPVAIAPTCPNTGTPRVLSIGVDPLDGRNVWLAIEVDGIRYSGDGGESWRTLDHVTPNPDGHCVVVTPGPPKTVFYAVNNEIYRSADDGATWAPLRVRETFPWGHVRNVTVHPTDPRTLYAAIGDATPGQTGAVMRSRDTGETWEALPLDAEPNSTMWRVCVQADDPDLVFAASRFGYLYRSDDGGDSWHKLRREFSEIADVVWFPN